MQLNNTDIIPQNEEDFLKMLEQEGETPPVVAESTAPPTTPAETAPAAPPAEGGTPDPYLDLREGAPTRDEILERVSKAQTPQERERLVEFASVLKSEDQAKLDFVTRHKDRLQPGSPEFAAVNGIFLNFMESGKHTVQSALQETERVAAEKGFLGEPAAPPAPAPIPTAHVISGNVGQPAGDVRGRGDFGGDTLEVLAKTDPFEAERTYNSWTPEQQDAWLRGEKV